MKLPYHGQDTCQIATCKKKAYYGTASGNFFCGRHSNKLPARFNLKKDPLAGFKKEQLYKQHRRTVEIARDLADGSRGNVFSTKMRMMTNPPLRPGVLNVFPNNRHQNRKDGFGCCSLSPMRLGPVGGAKNLENFHQFSKVYVKELNADGSIGDEYYRQKEKGFADPVPHRRKYTKDDKVAFSYILGRKFSYIESRYVYCFNYALLAEKTDDYKKLERMLNEGYDLNICGYDGRDFNEEQMYDYYCDPRQPFGHEMVLCCMLLGIAPWIRYFEEHRSVYE